MCAEELDITGMVPVAEGHDQSVRVTGDIEDDAIVCDTWTRCHQNGDNATACACRRGVLNF